MLRDIRRKARFALLSIKWAWQRLTRGWDDRALDSIDDWLEEKLAQMLPIFADITMGWPAILIEGDDGLPTHDPSFPFEAWQDEIREAAEKFRRLSQSDDFDSVEEELRVYEESWDWLRSRIGALWL